MIPFDCTLLSSSSTESLTQLYTGFGALAERNWVRTRLVKSSDYATAMKAKAKLTVVVTHEGTSYRVIYDTADGPEIFEKDLEQCDFYFKRSFHPSLVAAGGGKIYPLGLNYPVYGTNDYSAQRSLWSLADDKSPGKKNALVQIGRSSGALSRLLHTNGGRTNSSIANFEGLPFFSDLPRILFLARAWDPARIVKRGQEAVEERIHINTTRAECIRLLRREFGALFLGGFALDPYAAEHFKDCLVDDPAITRKGHYLGLVKAAGICIATMGLQGSNGWKLGEYVAGAKAIVSEKLCYLPAGNFEAGVNYLEFSTPEKCVTAVRELVDNPMKRYRMMQENHAYYHRALRPDILVWNTLQTVLNPAEAGAMAPQI